MWTCQETICSSKSLVEEEEGGATAAVEEEAKGEGQGKWPRSGRRAGGGLKL